MKRLFAFVLALVMLISTSPPAFAAKNAPSAIGKKGYDTTVKEYVELYEDALRLLWKDIVDSPIKKLKVEETNSSNIYHVTLSDLSTRQISLQLYRDKKEPKEKEIIDSAEILIMGADSDTDTYLFCIAACAMIMLVNDDVEGSDDANKVFDKVLAASADDKPYTSGGFE